MSLRPSLLCAGDQVAVVAPAGRVELQRVSPALDLLRSWGLEVLTGPTGGSRYFQCSADDATRFAELRCALEHPSVKAVFCARGGYGLVRLLPRLQALAGTLTPRWVVGYSDITALHSLINCTYGWQSVHGPMPAGFEPGPEHAQSWELLRQMLFSGQASCLVPPHPLNRFGSASGVLTGGNLSVLHGLTGTPFFPSVKPRILFLEEVGEAMYHVDRMMLNLKLSGVLSGLSGLIVGGMTDMKDDASVFGKDACAIIREHVEEYDYPVIFGFPAGHDALNRPLLMGAECSLEVGQSGVVLSFP